jgi:CheY-like chemotaxis protein
MDIARAMRLDDPDESLEDVTEALGALGLVRTPGAGTPWLTVTAGERTLALDRVVRSGGKSTGATEPDGPTRALVEMWLGAALLRATGHDAHRRTSERLEMLPAAYFEGLMFHVDGVGREPLWLVRDHRGASRWRGRADPRGRGGLDVRRPARTGGGVLRPSARPPDVVVLDMTMPDIDGAEVLRASAGLGLASSAACRSATSKASSRSRTGRPTS